MPNFSNFTIENSNITLGTFYSEVSLTASFSSGFSGFGVGLPPSSCSGFSIANISTTDPTCGLNNGSINITSSGGTSPFQYSIDNGSSFQSSGNFTDLAPGSYSVLVEDAMSCQATASLTLTAGSAGPNIQFAFDTVITMQTDTVQLIPGHLVPINGTPVLPLLFYLSTTMELTWLLLQIINVRISIQL